MRHPALRWLHLVMGDIYSSCLPSNTDMQAFCYVRQRRPPPRTDSPQMHNRPLSFHRPTLLMTHSADGARAPPRRNRGALSPRLRRPRPQPPSRAARLRNIFPPPVPPNHHDALCVVGRARLHARAQFSVFLISGLPGRAGAPSSVSGFHTAPSHSSPPAVPLNYLGGLQ